MGAWEMKTRNNTGDLHRDRMRWCQQASRVRSRMRLLDYPGIMNCCVQGPQDPACYATNLSAATVFTIRAATPERHTLGCLPQTTAS